jgi:1,2-diacylglycerol 3-alpha-glucosyltransferase
MSAIVPLRILNIGLDASLLSRSGDQESQLRQIGYARELPAEVTHIVKSTIQLDNQSVTLDNGQVIIVPAPVRHSGLFPVVAARVGTQILKRAKFDLIQVQEPVLCGTAGLYLARRFKLPLVAGAFSDQICNPNWVSNSLINRVANAVGKFVYARANAIRADSEAVAQRLAANGFLQTRFVPFLITNAEALAQSGPGSAEIRQRLLRGCDGPLLLAVARLEPEKNISLLLRAFMEVKKVIPGVVLAIAGDGSLRSQLEQSVPESSVRWLGWVPNKDLGNYYQAADIMVLSSDNESSARVLTESLLAGTPIVTTDTAGAREIVEDGLSGRIVPVGDVTAFGAALLELCCDPARRQSMGQRGLQNAQRLSSRKAVIDGLRNLYYDVTRRDGNESAAL